MAVTQIVGPRIAPLWADPVEWTSARAYEPFTFVTYQGDSYCSRQDTPIGIDITNDDYWVKVSDYNAQAVALQRSMTQTIETAETNMENTIQTAENSMTEQVNAVESVKNELQGSLDDISASKIVTTQVSQNNYFGNILLIGDSYMEGYSLGESGALYLNSFGMRVQNWFNNNTKRHVYMTYHGGWSFCNGTWTELLNTFVATLTDTEKNSISDVYVCGGANDRHNTAEQIKNGISNFVNALKANLPYAKLHVVFIGAAITGLAKYHTDTNQTAFNTVVKAYQYNAFQFGYSFTNASGVIKFNKYMSLDYFHPNQNGQNELADTLFNIINGSEPITYGITPDGYTLLMDHAKKLSTYSPNTDGYHTNNATVANPDAANIGIAVSSTNPYYAGAFPWANLTLTYCNISNLDLQYDGNWVPGTVYFDCGTINYEGIAQAPSKHPIIFQVPMIATYDITPQVYHQFVSSLIIVNNHLLLRPFIGNPWRNTDTFNHAYFTGTLHNVQTIINNFNVPEANEHF